MTSTCQNCGTNTTETAKFCGECGKPISKTEPTSTTEVLIQPEVNPNITEFKKPFRVRHPRWNIFFILIVCAVLFEYLIYAFNKEATIYKNTPVYGLFVSAFFTYQYFSEKYKNKFLLLVSPFIGALLFILFAIGMTVLKHALKN